MKPTELWRLLLLMLVASLLGPAWGASPRKVTLHLKWSHQFQFAGFYAAQAKGFYAAAGLEVSFREASKTQLPLPAVESGEAEFGVSDMEVFQAYLEGRPLVALGVTFQHSPNTLLALRSKGIHRPADLAGRKIMFQGGQGLVEAQAMLEAEGLRLDAIQKVPHSWNLSDLLEGRIDALSAYSTHEPYLLKQLGADFVSLRPSDYGVDFYGDLLFTTQAFAAKHPDLTEAFRRASFQGWEYAMEHPEEMIDHILTLPSVAARSTTRGELLFEAEQMRDQLLPGLVDAGHMNPGRLDRIAEIMVKQGLVKSMRGHDGFLFSPRASAPPTWLRALKMWLLVALGVALIAVLWITQLRRTLRIQTAALETEARERQQTAEALRLSVERYDNLAARIPIGVYLIRSRPNGTFGFEYISPRMAELFGLELNRLQADIRLAFQAVHPEDSEAFVKLNQDGLKYLAPFDWEGRIVVHEEIRWLHIASTPERLDTGDVLWHGIVADITAHQRADQALRVSEQRLAYAVSATSDAIWEWHYQTGETYYSPHWYELLGYTDQAFPMTFEAFRELCHPDDFQPMVDRITAVLAVPGGKGFEAEFRMRTQSGAWCWILSRGNVVEWDSAGRPLLLCGTNTDISERQRMLNSLRQSEQRLRALFEGAPIGMFHTTLEGHFIRVNAAQASLFRYASAEEMIEQIHPDGAANDLWVVPEGRALFVERVLAAHGQYLQEEVQFRRKDGSFFDGILFMRVTQHPDLEEPYLEGFLQDLSERKQAEEVRENLNAQLVQAQKMEVVGRLAGGVAHDFNNMLGVIMGRADLGLLQVPPESPIGVSLKEILKAAQHSADLTRQLLAFARKQTVTPRVMNLNDTVDGLLKMLRRLIGEAIDLAWLPSAGLWSLKMDPTQINQILANLCVNAKDAIQGTGKVIIETKNVVLTALDCTGHLGWEPGQFILLTVRDSGSGIAPEALPHIFEPFFTTKGAGQGTGLGLATVYGIVQQNNGFIDVSSELGQGTRFNIYLPRTTLAKVEAAEETPKPAPQGHGETLLVVEDEESLRALSCEVLERLGYRVLAAQAPSDALILMKAHRNEISLVITDVIMPGMNGRELVEQLIEMKPGLKYLFMSGYPANIIAHQGAPIEDLAFLPKPFSFQGLAAKVREVMGAEATGPT